jgi:hypothetical protein
MKTEREEQTQGEEVVENNFMMIQRLVIMVNTQFNCYLCSGNIGSAQGVSGSATGRGGFPATARGILAAAIGTEECNI